MLDFHGLFPSYVALFPGGVYMKIEYLRLDLHLKRKQKKPQGQHQRVHQRRKKKKKPREEGKKKKKKKTRDSRAATWVCRDLGSARPGSRPATQGATVACVAGLDLARPGSA